jgi:hypothetical protein
MAINSLNVKDLLSLILSVLNVLVLMALLLRVQNFLSKFLSCLAFIEVTGRIFSLVFYLILRKSGKMSNIKIAEIWEKTAEIWEKFKYKNCGNLGKKSISKLRKSGKIMRKSGNLLRNSGNLSIFLNLQKYGKMLWCFPPNWGHK